MEKFQVTVLGCASAKPSTRHFPSAHVVNVHERYYMVDCGEGAQIQLSKARVRFTGINAIFITHLHGDHCFGLPGLLSTFSLLGRATPLDVFGPPELEAWLQAHLRVFTLSEDFPLRIHSVRPGEQAVVYEDKAVQVETLPLRHRVPCCGYLFREKPQLPHIRRDMIDFYGIPYYRIPEIKDGADWQTPDGQTVPNSRLVRPANPPRTYAYCSDTVYLPQLAERVRGVGLLYHEATYAAGEEALARERFHSTARQAARLADEAGAGQLLIGHFSSRYHDLAPLLQEAQDVFPNTLLADEMLNVPVCPAPGV